MRCTLKKAKKTPLFKCVPGSPGYDKVIDKCAGILKAGGLVCFPTETVYGIAANALDRTAIDRLYRVKNRPRGKPFTVHIADLDGIKKMGCPITKRAMALIDRFWPGPLTIVLASKTGEKIGFRMPANIIAMDLIAASEVPVVAPSANISGENPPINASAALKGLNGRIDAVLDGGPAAIGVESTVIDMTVNPPNVLREGAIGKEVMRSLANSSPPIRKLLAGQAKLKARGCKL